MDGTDLGQCIFPVNNCRPVVRFKVAEGLKIYLFDPLVWLWFPEVYTVGSHCTGEGGGGSILGTDPAGKAPWGVKIYFIFACEYCRYGNIFPTYKKLTILFAPIPSVGW